MKRRKWTSTVKAQVERKQDDLAGSILAGSGHMDRILQLKLPAFRFRIPITKAIGHLL